MTDPEPPLSTTARWVWRLLRPHSIRISLSPYTIPQERTVYLYHSEDDSLAIDSPAIGYRARLTISGSAFARLMLAALDQPHGFVGEVQLGKQWLVNDRRAYRLSSARPESQRYRHDMPAQWKYWPGEPPGVGQWLIRLGPDEWIGLDVDGIHILPLVGWALRLEQVAWQQAVQNAAGEEVPVPVRSKRWYLYQCHRLSLVFTSQVVQVPRECFVAGKFTAEGAHRECFRKFIHGLRQGVGRKDMPLKPEPGEFYSMLRDCILEEDRRFFRAMIHAQSPTEWGSSSLEPQQEDKYDDYVPIHTRVVPSNKLTNGLPRPRHKHHGKRIRSPRMVNCSKIHRSIMKGKMARTLRPCRVRG